MAHGEIQGNGPAHHYADDRQTVIRVVVDAHCGVTKAEAQRRFAASIEELVLQGAVAPTVREVHVIRAYDGSTVLVYCRDAMTVLGVQFESERGRWQFSSKEAVIAERLGPRFVGHFGSSGKGH
jgi:hypothetical protein